MNRWRRWLLRHAGRALLPLALVWVVAIAGAVGGLEVRPTLVGLLVASFCGAAILAVWSRWQRQEVAVRAAALLQFLKRKAARRLSASVRQGLRPRRSIRGRRRGCRCCSRSMPFTHRRRLQPSPTAATSCDAVPNAVPTPAQCTAERAFRMTGSAATPTRWAASTRRTALATAATAEAAAAAAIETFIAQRCRSSRTSSTMGERRGRECPSGSALDPDRGRPFEAFFRRGRRLVLQARQP